MTVVINGKKVEPSNKVKLYWYLKRKEIYEIIKAKRAESDSEQQPSDDT